ncbi:hypothetical protein MC885_006705 [Smutsia gigantea]|nr:hypothetical protein MC885_006705 [Smutsia gigantea]
MSVATIKIVILDLLGIGVFVLGPIRRERTLRPKLDRLFGNRNEEYIKQKAEALEFMGKIFSS